MVGRSAFLQVKNEAMRYLESLGYDSSMSESYPVSQGTATGIISYVSYQKSSIRPYLTVVLFSENVKSLPFFEMSGLEFQSPYVAFTNGHTWMWYQRNVGCSDFIPLENPLAPPPMPASGKRLRPFQDKKEFKQFLQFMNNALRDSMGGGIIERFDSISKILFTKVFDEREVEQGQKRTYDFRIETEDTPELLLTRIEGLWQRIHSEHESLQQTKIPEFIKDKAALYKIVANLQNINLLETPGDIKGVAYEEILKNTFEKDENQQFFTPHEVVEFMVSMIRPQKGELICDPACGTGGFLVESFRDIGVSDGLVGIDVDERISRVARMNLLMQGANNARIYHLPGAGSLMPFEQLEPFAHPDSFDVILTNPPFGSDFSDEKALKNLEMGRGRSSRRRGVLFVERCLELLRPGGRMAIVLDDSILNSSTNADIRSLILKRSSIEAVVSLPDVTFMPYSTAKSSILFLRKKQDGEEAQESIFMANVENVGRKFNGDPLYTDKHDTDGKKILQNDLPKIASIYKSFKTNRNAEFDNMHTFVVAANMLDDRLDIFYYHPQRFAAEQEIENSRWPIFPLSELVSLRTDNIMPAREFGDSPIRWLGLADIEEFTGELDIKVVPGDKFKSPAHQFKGGDILFSRLRPNLRKVALIPDTDEGGLCSSEFLVLCAHDANLRSKKKSKREAGAAVKIDFEYLAFILRSDLVYGQLMYKVTGVGRPRVSLETVLSIKVPVPPLEEQKRIVSVLKQAWESAFLAKNEAKRYLEQSKQIVDNAYEQIFRDLTSLVEG